MKEIHFKPFDKVLVRNKNIFRRTYWIPALFYMRDDSGLIITLTSDKKYDEAIPYEGNEKYLGTLDDYYVEPFDCTAAKVVDNKHIIVYDKEAFLNTDIDKMTEEYRNSLPFGGELETYGDALCHAYKQGLTNMLNAIKNRLEND